MFPHIEMEILNEKFIFQNKKSGNNPISTFPNYDFKYIVDFCFEFDIRNRKNMYE